MKAYYCSDPEHSDLESICVAYCNSYYQARKIALSNTQGYVDDYSLSDIKAQRVKKLDCLYGEIEGNCVDLWDSLGNFEILVEKGFIRYMTEKEREEYQTKYDLIAKRVLFFYDFGNQRNENKKHKTYWINRNPKRFRNQ